MLNFSLRRLGMPYSVILVLLLTYNLAIAQNSTTFKKNKILIPYLQQISSTGIFVTEAEMTKLIFEDLNSLNQFEVKFVPRDNSGENGYNPEVEISGSYRVNGNLISLDYIINLKKTGMKLMHRIDNTELPEIKKNVLRDFSDILVDFQIEADPPDVSVKMDGRDIGKAPLLVTSELIGSHTFEIRKEDFYGIIQDIEITRPETLKFSLQPQIIESFMTDEPAQPEGGLSEIQRKATYPKISQKLHIEGDVIIKVTIDVDGSVVKTEVLKSIGDYGTTEAAINAIKEVKWKPGIKNNKPVKSNTTVVVRFKMSK